MPVHRIRKENDRNTRHGTRSGTGTLTFGNGRYDTVRIGTYLRKEKNGKYFAPFKAVERIIGYSIKWGRKARSTNFVPAHVRTPADLCLVARTRSGRIRRGVAGIGSRAGTRGERIGRPKARAAAAAHGVRRIAGGGWIGRRRLGCRRNGGETAVGTGGGGGIGQRGRRHRLFGPTVHGRLLAEGHNANLHRKISMKKWRWLTAFGLFHEFNSGREQVRVYFVIHIQWLT